MARSPAPAGAGMQHQRSRSIIRVWGNAKLRAEEVHEQQQRQADLDDCAQLTDKLSCLPEDCL